MQFRDTRSVALTAASSRSALQYDAVVERIAGYHADPFTLIDRGLAADPTLVSLHCARAAIGVMAAERPAEALIRQSLAAAKDLPANERERRHLEAAETWLAGDFHRAADLYGAIALDHPRDLLALQVAHVGDFYLGRQRLLRDRIAQILPAWGEQTPGYGYVLGMLAFGLEETNRFEAAETAGLRALERDARDVWAVHAVTHCFEMTGRADAGAQFLEGRRADWAVDNAFAFHNHWHLALFELERENLQRVFELFDRAIWPKPSVVALEMVDAVALLFRLYLRGVDLGGRAASVADAWSDPAHHGYYAFNDAHAVMAFVAGGRLPDARRLVRALELGAGEDGSNAQMTRDVGLPLARALIAFGEARYDLVVETLLPLRLVAHQFGGSNAQRDILDQTLAEAAIRAGRPVLARALAAERRLLRPRSTWASYLERAAATQRVA
ncbi:MAG TPA: tetratricopeptide repeat protein [Polyangiaceae bacterium]